MAERSNHLNQMSIFKELDESQMNLLRPLFEPFTCQAGTIILQQGSPAEYLYLIHTGKVEISYKPYDGNPITVSHVEEGDSFGWSALLGSKEYTSSATAIERVEAVRVRGSELREFCIEHPEAGKDILERLADGVSSRWEDAHRQVKSILVQGLQC